MAIKFSRKLVLFNNTLNNYIHEYSSLCEQLRTGNVDNTLGDTFTSIRTISEKIRNLQVNFTEGYALKKKSLAPKWLVFGSAFKEYLDATVEHTQAIEDLMILFTNNTTWRRIWNFRKTFNSFSRADKIARRCQENREIINQLIESEEYK